MKTILSFVLMLATTASFALGMNERVLFKSSQNKIVTGTITAINGSTLTIDVDGSLEDETIEQSKVGQLSEKCSRGIICVGTIVNFYDQNDELVEGEVFEVYTNEFMIVEYGDNEEAILNFADIESIK